MAFKIRENVFFVWGGAPHSAERAHDSLPDLLVGCIRRGHDSPAFNLALATKTQRHRRLRLAGGIVSPKQIFL